MMLLSIAAAIATMTIKFVAYRLTDSVGLFSDATESLVNLAAALFGFYALRVASRPPDADHAFGHQKVEYFASALEGALIVVAAAWIAEAAVVRLRTPEPLGQLGLGLLISLGASAINGATALALLRVARREDAIVLEADGRHLLTDVWTSLGVLAGLSLVLVFPGALWIDPLVALLVALNIARVGYALLRRSVDGLMDVALPATEQELIARVVHKVLPVSASIADLRTRKAGSLRFISFDLRVPGTMTVACSHALCDVIEGALRAALPPCSVTIHVEPIRDPGVLESRR